MKPEFISVARFAEFQHYSQRNPPWIKLHTRLLDDERYITLPDAQKAALMGLFLQAARSDNKILNDPRWLQGKLGLKSKPDIPMLISKGWLEEHHGASDPLAKRKRVDSAAPAERKQTARAAPPTRCLPQSESETESEEINIPLQSIRDAETVQKAWNAMAAEHGLAEVTQITPARAQMLRYLYRGGWTVLDLLAVARAAPALKNGSFTPDFDWVFRNRENCLRALERAKVNGNGAGTPNDDKYTAAAVRNNGGGGA